MSNVISCFQALCISDEANSHLVIKNSKHQSLQFMTVIFIEKNSFLMCMIVIFETLLHEQISPRLVILKREIRNSPRDLIQVHTSMNLVSNSAWLLNINSAHNVCLIPANRSVYPPARNSMNLAINFRSPHASNFHIILNS